MTLSSKLSNNLFEYKGEMSVKYFIQLNPKKVYSVILNLVHKRKIIEIIKIIYVTFVTKLQ